MNAEIGVYAQELCWILNQIASTLDGLTEPQLNWSPATGRANSACAIASHVVGSTRVYALGFGCGQLVERDRPAEFAASAVSSRELISAIQQLADEIGTALATLTPSLLDRRIRPSQELWGTGEPREVSGREAIVESIRHAALHLGELRLTRDLALQHG
jgi:hypothetical protein